MKTAKILLGLLMATTLTHDAMSSMLNKIIQIPVLELNKFNKIEKTSKFEFNPSEIPPLKHCYYVKDVKIEGVPEQKEVLFLVASSEALTEIAQKKLIATVTSRWRDKDVGIKEGFLNFNYEDTSIENIKKSIETNWEILDLAVQNLPDLKLERGFGHMMKFIFKNNHVLALSRNKFSANQSLQNIPLELAFEVFKEKQNQHLTSAQFRDMKKQKQKPKKIDLNNRFKDEEHDSIGAVTFKHKHSNQSKDNSIQNEKSFVQPTLKSLSLARSKTPAMQLSSDQKK